MNYLHDNVAKSERRWVELLSWMFRSNLQFSYNREENYYRIIEKHGYRIFIVIDIWYLYNNWVLASLNLVRNILIKETNLVEHRSITVVAFLVEKVWTREQKH